MPGLLRSFVWSVGLYALLSGIMDGPGALLTGLLGMELSPHFDKPWMANSSASFWNKRWVRLPFFCLSLALAGQLPTASLPPFQSVWVGFVLSSCHRRRLLCGRPVEGYLHSCFLRPLHMVLETQCWCCMSK